MHKYTTPIPFRIGYLSIPIFPVIPVIISRTDIGKGSQDQVADEDVYDKRDQRGKIDHKLSQFQIRNDFRERAYQRSGGAIDPSHKRSAQVGNEELENESEQQQKFNHSDHKAHQCSDNAEHIFVLIVSLVLYSAAALKQAYDDQDECDDQQCVDQPAERERSDKSQSPENDQDYDYCPHIFDLID